MSVIRWAVAAWFLLAGAAAAPAAEREVFRREAEKLQRGDHGVKTSIVSDATAAGGKAVRVPYGIQKGWPQAVTRLVIGKVRLQQRVRIRLQCRQQNMLDLARPVQWKVHLNDDKGQHHYIEHRDAGMRFNPKGWTDIDLEGRLPMAPAEYAVEIHVAWVAQDHWRPSPEADWPGGAVKPTLDVDRVTIFTGRGDSPFIAEVEPGKVRFEPGKKAFLEVALGNPLDTPATVRLKGQVRWGLDHERDVFDDQIALKPGEQRTVKPEWTAGKQEYGRRAVVTLVYEGKTVDRADHMLSVCSHPYLLSIARGDDYGLRVRNMHHVFYVPPATYQQSARSVRYFRRRFGQWKEFFSWAPGDLTDLAPQEDPYIGGEGGAWWRGREEVRMQIGLLHDAGLHVTTYINGTAWADSGYKLFQKHPDWFLYNANGEVEHYSMYRRHLYTRRRYLDFPSEKYDRIYFQGVLNHALPEVQRFCADMIIRSGKEMGFDGLRMDVRYFEVKPGEFDWRGREVVKTQAEADRLSAGIVRTIKRMVHEQLPGYTFGYNFSAPEENKDWPLTFAERCRGKAWMLDEVPCTYQGKQSPYHWWDKYARRIVEGSTLVRKLDGVYNPFDFRRGGGHYVVDRVYSTIFRLLAGGRFSTYYNTSFPMGDVAALATRHSAMFFDPKLEWIEEPGSTVRVTAKAPVWWKDFVHSRVDSSGRRQLIVHLVNPPMAEEVEGDPLSRARPAVRQVRVRVGSFKGKTAKRAFLLAAEPDDPSAPPAVRTEKLKIERTRVGRMAVTVPSVLFWKIVVFEY